jgi:hypothetical protein
MSAGLAPDSEVMAQECGFANSGSRAASKLPRDEIIEGGLAQGPVNP